MFNGGKLIDHVYTTIAFIFIYIMSNSAAIAADKTSAAYSAEVLLNKPSKVQVRFDFDKPDLKVSGGEITASLKGAQIAPDGSGYLLPVVTKIVHLPHAQQIRAAVVDAREEEISIEQTYAQYEDPSIKGRFSNQTLEVRALGRYKDMHLYALYVRPVQYDAGRSVIRWYKRLTVDLIPQNREDDDAVASETYRDDALIRKGLINKPLSLNASRSSSMMTLSQSQPSVNEEALAYLNYSTVYKIEVDEDGIYQVTYDQLKEAGFPVDQVQAQKLKLYNKGREIPIYIKGETDDAFDPGDYFEFWATKNKKTFYPRYPDLYSDPFSDKNVYWLVEANIRGHRMVEESGGVKSNQNRFIFEPYAYRQTLHFEKNQYFEHFGQPSSNLNRPSYEIDHWYYDSGVQAPEGGAYDFFLPYPFESGADVVVKAALRGKSFYSYPNNILEGHQVSLKFRGAGNKSKLIGRVMPQDGWRNQEMKIISNEDSTQKISQSLLQHGTNRLEIDMFQQGVSDIVMLNWFEITYLRRYRAHDDYIKFHVDETFFDGQYISLGDTLQFKIDGFGTDNVSLYKLGNSKLTNIKVERVQQDGESFYRLTFQDEVFDPEVQYVALAEGTKKKPAAINAYRPWNPEVSQRSLLDADNSAEFLIITHNLLYNNALELKSLKEQQGYDVEVVTVENIYDTFNHGVKSPIAIKNFLRYALEQWEQAAPLKFVLFVGDASYNYKSNADLVPTFLYQTEKFGASASDYWYALLSGDDYIPDVTVSRIPAENNRQLLNYIDKIERYTNAGTVGKWRNSALFLSGNDAGTEEYLTNEPAFRAQNLRLINSRLPQSMFTLRLNTVKDEDIEGFDPHFGSTTDLIEYFDEGVSYINFFGHGGGAIWADVQLLNLNDVERIRNPQRLPFVTSMTCFTGAFENAGRQSLSEKLILAPEKGAIAVLGASGLGWLYNDFAVSWGLFDYLWQEDMSIGEAVDLMKIYYLANPFYYTEEGAFTTFGYSQLYKSIVTQYNLFGDPSLTLQKPQQAADITLNNAAPSPGDSIIVNIDSPLNDGQGVLMLQDEEGLNVYEQTFSVTGGEQQVGLRLPNQERLIGQNIRVKSYVSDGESDASGATVLGVERPVVASIKTIPENPQVGDSIAFELKAAGSADVQRISLTNFHSLNQRPSQTVIAMQAVSDSLYRSEAPYPGFSSRGQKLYDIEVEDKQGKIYKYRWRKLYIADDRPDFAVDPKSLTFSGQYTLKLKFKINNHTDRQMQDVTVACYADSGIERKTPFAQKSLDMDANESKLLALETGGALDVRASAYRIRVSIDPDNSIDERDESNNQTTQVLDNQYLELYADIGTSPDGITNDTLSLQDRWRLYMPPGAVQKDRVFRYELKDISDLLSKKNQNGLQYIALDNQPDSVALELDFAEKTLPAELSVKLSASQLALQDVDFFRFDKRLAIWKRVSGTLRNNRLMISPIKPGLYAVFHSTDQNEPLIELTSNGRPLVDDMLVFHKPNLSVMLQDENGINLNEAFDVRLDDQTLIDEGVILNDEIVSLPDSIKNGKAVSVQLTPSFDTGDHRIEINVKDASGNVSQKGVQFRVTQGFDIRVFGNYPNPFEDETIISYYIDSDNPIDDFSIKIYSTSGRLIRESRLTRDESIAQIPINDPFYHELIWDGTDDNGVEVANGVYYAIIKGSYKGETVTHTIKMAKLK